jgi:hypothetical protein
MKQRLLHSLAHDSIVDDILVSGLSTFEDLVRTVQQLPYGRNANRFDPELVWKEQKGSCSSKHAFLKKVADEQGFDSVQLILGIYKMNTLNTPGIGDSLSNTSLKYIPEAHCYLSIDGQRLDITFPQSNIEKLLPDMLEEQFIEWPQVGEFKVEYHKAFIKKWLKRSRRKISFEEVWEIRERCILRMIEGLKD